MGDNQRVGRMVLVGDDGFHSLILLHWGRDHHADNYVR